MYYKMRIPERWAEIQANMRVAEEACCAVELAAMEEDEEMLEKEVLEEEEESGADDEDAAMEEDTEDARGYNFAMAKAEFQNAEA